MLTILKWLGDFGLRLNRLYYRQLFLSGYCRGRQSPSWFDHRIDLYYEWPHNLFWLERGILARKHMYRGCTVLDLFCGDGFYSRYFYSTIAGHIDAVDRDVGAIAHARRWHSHRKVNYMVLDTVKEDFPRPLYDIIVWCEGIEHLSQTQYWDVIDRVKRSMGRDGLLFGSTSLVNEQDYGKGNWEHQNEFSDVAELRKYLEADFSQVNTETTVYPTCRNGERRTAYFTLKGPR